jgi:hypothetical protein
MQVAMTVAATKIQILQESNLTQAKEPSSVAATKKTSKDDAPACNS